MITAFSKQACSDQIISKNPPRDIREWGGWGWFFDTGNGNGECVCTNGGGFTGMGVGRRAYSTGGGVVTGSSDVTATPPLAEADDVLRPQRWGREATWRNKYAI